jgi:hypothetical protein
MEYFTHYNAQIPVEPYIEGFEITWSLPSIEGTPRQIKYARDVRFHILDGILPHREYIAKHADDEQLPFLDQTIERLRNLRNPTTWISMHKRYCSSLTHLYIEACNDQRDEVYEKTNDHGYPRT